MPTLPGMLRPLIPALAVLLASACGSTGTSGSSRPEITGVPMTIKLVDYRSGNVLRLVNESHSDRVETYSEEAGAPGTKVASDEIVAVTIEQMQEDGFERYALRGLAPVRTDAYSKSIEIDDPSGVRHIAIPPQPEQDEWRTMQRCSATFIAVYNRIYAAQAVSNPSGARLFLEEKRELQREQGDVRSKHGLERD